MANDAKEAKNEQPPEAKGEAGNTVASGLMAEHRVNLEFFEGPLDLLIYLIKKNEYDIFDIPIAEITEQYLDYLEVLKEVNIDLAGEFIVMAATLIKIKSRMLLPRQEADEEEDGEDPRAALVKQLLEYQKYKEAAEQLRENQLLGRDVFARSFPSPELSKVETEESTYLDVDVYQMIEALRGVLNRLPEKTAHVINMEPYSVRERMSQLVEMLKGAESVAFDQLFKETSLKIEVITTFLALLELVRIQMFKVYQTKLHEPIRIMPLVVGDADIDANIDPDSGSGEDDNSSGEEK